MRNIKISKKYWDSLKDFEKEYIQKYTSENKDNVLWELKEIINNARKQYPDYVGFAGYYSIILKNGDIYEYSGSDTKRFNLIEKVNKDSYISSQKNYLSDYKKYLDKILNSGKFSVFYQYFIKEKKEEDSIIFDKKLRELTFVSKNMILVTKEENTEIEFSLTANSKKLHTPIQENDYTFLSFASINDIDNYINIFPYYKLHNLRYQKIIHNFDELSNWNFKSKNTLSIDKALKTLYH